MSVSLVSLNIEGDKHFHRFLPFLKQLQPDVICLQEVFEADLPAIEAANGMRPYFIPCVLYKTSNQYRINPRGSWGICLLTRLKLNNIQHHYFVGKEELIPGFVDGQPNSTNRAVIVALVEKDHQLYRVATTHLTWSKAGEATPEQLFDTKNLLKVLEQYPDLLLCGDFNAPRGKSTREMISHKYIDNIPLSVKSTLDSILHYAAPLDLVVDGLFSTPDYMVENLQVVEGVSDHCAITAEVTKNS